MSRSAMASRCPGARQVGTARLDGHRFSICDRGVSTVEPHDGSTVHGVVWEVTDAHIKSLDRYEGVAGGFYRRGTRTVTLEDGTRAEAVVYYTGCGTTGPARPSYINAVVNAAALQGLPGDYVVELAKWKPKDVPSRKRRPAPTAASHATKAVLGHSPDGTLAHLGPRWAKVRASGAR